MLVITLVALCATIATFIVTRTLVGEIIAFGIVVASALLIRIFSYGDGLGGSSKIQENSKERKISDDNINDKKSSIGIEDENTSVQETIPTPSSSTQDLSPMQDPTLWEKRVQNFKRKKKLLRDRVREVDERDARLNSMCINVENSLKALAEREVKLEQKERQLEEQEHDLKAAQEVVESDQLALKQRESELEQLEKELKESQSVLDNKINALREKKRGFKDKMNKICALRELDLNQRESAFNEDMKLQMNYLENKRLEIQRELQIINDSSKSSALSPSFSS